MVGQFSKPIDRILRNEKYIGIWKWGITESKRHPKSGKTYHIKRAEGPRWVSVHEDLRIVPQELWDLVQARLKEVEKVWPGGKGGKGLCNQRGSYVEVFPRELLSAAMVCSVCHGAIGKVSGKLGGYYGCLKAVGGGCSNKIIVRKKIAEPIILSAVAEILNSPENMKYMLLKVEKEAANLCDTVPEDIRQKEAELSIVNKQADSYVNYISKGDDSERVRKSLVKAEQRAKVLESELNALYYTKKSVFKAPPLEWVQERVANVKAVLEKRTGQSANLLRQLLGKISLEPVTPDIGKPYLRAVSRLQPLALFEEEKAPKEGPLPFESEPATVAAAGSISMSWWRWRPSHSSGI